ncbi:hypothetical protein FRC01_005600, partial [Tulasnella sp. 417]
MLTDQLGDFMRFSFKGTGFSVIGTRGVRQGQIEFDFDDYVGIVDRGYPKLECDHVLFEMDGLPYEEHSFVAQLVAKDINPRTGEEDGVFSIQRI